MTNAGMTALEERDKLQDRSSDASRWTIKEDHFKKALKNITPSVSDRVGKKNLTFAFSLYNVICMSFNHHSVPLRLQQREYYEHLSEKLKAA